MFLIYNLILPVFAIILSPLIAVAFIVKPKLRAGFWQKIGLYSKTNYDKSTSDKTIVFHAVSVGEVNAVSPLIKKYREQNKSAYIVLTTTTKTGQEVAKKLLSDYVSVITYFPYDFCFSVSSFFRTFNPQQVIIAETEIWPCFVSIAAKKGIKTYIVNGRISPNSHRGYKRFEIFFRNILNKYEKILMQSKGDAERIIDVGAPKDKVFVMGNLKYDITQPISKQKVIDLKSEFSLDPESKLFIAASTHTGEDEIILSLYTNLAKVIPSLKLLVAPRHPQRYGQVEKVITSLGYKLGRRSNKATFSEYDVIMLDTMGELSKVFSFAHVAFIGGSFSNTGGHNPLEANIWGVPVLSGPAIFNFKDIYKFAISKKAAFVVTTEEDLYFESIQLLTNGEKYAESSIGAKEIFSSNRGAIDFVLKEI